MHGVDVEGMQLGVDEELVQLLGQSSPIPVTYAGGVRSLVRNCIRPPKSSTSAHMLTSAYGDAFFCCMSISVHQPQ